MNKIIDKALTNNEKEYQRSHVKCRDGFGMSVWPEFLRLMDRLGVRVPKRHKTVLVRFPCPHKGENITVAFDGEVIDTGYGLEVGPFFWPETQAWLRRLGVPVGLYTISLSVEFGIGHFPKVLQEYAAAEPEGSTGKYATDVVFSDEGYIVSWKEPSCPPPS